MFQRLLAHEMCIMFKGHCHHDFGKFNLRVLGWVRFVEHEETVRAVGVEFLVSQREVLDNKIFELRDVWWSHNC